MKLYNLFNLFEDKKQKVAINGELGTIEQVLFGEDPWILEKNVSAWKMSRDGVLTVSTGNI